MGQDGNGSLVSYDGDEITVEEAARRLTEEGRDPKEWFTEHGYGDEYEAFSREAQEPFTVEMPDGNRLEEGEARAWLRANGMDADEYIAEAKREAGLDAGVPREAEGKREAGAADGGPEDEDEAEPFEVEMPDGNYLTEDAARDWLLANGMDADKYIADARHEAGLDVEGDGPGYAAREPEPPKGPGTIREDMKSWYEAVKDQKESDSYACWSEDGGKTRKYVGALGTFEFDSSEFALARVHVPASSYGEGGTAIALRYIGKETDGRKIKVPEGLKDASYMFMGTDIKTAPRLPDSVTTATQAFRSCSSLKYATEPLPPDLDDGAFMFADCPVLEQGPKRLPEKMRNASYMFAEDSRLRVAPEVNAGVEGLDGTFAYCRGIKAAPKIPDSCQASTKNLTVGCDGLDRNKAAKDQKTYERQRAKAEKKANGVGFMGHLASMCSAVAQYHMMRQQGFNLITAPYMVHKMRENGSYGKNWSDMFGAMTKNNNTRAVFKEMSRSETAKREARAKKYMERWEQMYGENSVVTRKVRGMAASGERDFQNDVFGRANNMEFCEKHVYGSGGYGKETIYRAKEELFAQQWDDMDPPYAAKKKMVDWYLERASENAAYYNSAKDAITKGTRGEVREEQMRGLGTIMDVQNKPLFESLARMDRDYDLLDERDKAKFSSIAKRMGVESELFASRGDTEQAAVERMRTVSAELIAPEEMPGPKAAEAQAEQADVRKPPEAEQAAGHGPSEAGRTARQKAAPEEQAGQSEAGRNAKPGDPGAVTPADAPNAKEILQETASRAKGAAADAAKMAGRSFSYFLVKARAAVAAAAEAFTEAGQAGREPVQEREDEASGKQGASRNIGRNMGGGDVSDRTEQVKVDEAKARDQMQNAVEEKMRASAEEKAGGADRGKEAERVLGSRGEPSSSGRESDGRDVTD